MTIDELLAAIGLTANDEIPLWDAEATVEEPTKKITATNFAAAVKALASLIATTDVKDVLNSTSATDPLSANQGKVLNDRASAISDDITAAYDPTSTYDLGDLCIYNNTLYRCTTAITTAEAWTAAHWTATTVEAELAGKLTPDDVVNNLTSTETTKPLSAAQGKALNDHAKNFGLVGEHLTVSGTTDSVGKITINKTIRFNREAYVLTNVRDTNTKNYCVVVSDISATNVTLRIRNGADNSAVTNASVDFTIMLVGLEV